VTNAEYLTFLNDLVRTGREAEAIAACPKIELGMGDAFGERRAFDRDAAGRFALVEQAEGREQPDWPVVLVDWHAAMAYARWLGAQTGQPWRLPNELEREKAARGVDGRLCPWGNYLDATFACVAEGQAGDLTRFSVTSYPVDESPYGVRGLSGGSRDWCINLWSRDRAVVDGGRLVVEPASADDGGFRSVRGGAWSSQLGWSRSASRFANRPKHHRAAIGFRVVRSL
jgi:eukaryotic-like serine/threonine-protein kinase